MCGCGKTTTVTPKVTPKTNNNPVKTTVTVTTKG